MINYLERGLIIKTFCPLIVAQSNLDFYFCTLVKDSVKISLKSVEILRIELFSVARCLSGTEGRVIVGLDSDDKVKRVKATETVTTPI